MSGSKPSVSVVICCYTDERFDDVLAAVDSVQRQSAAPAEIVVVVDHKSPLLERLHAAHPELATIQNGERQGLSGARNSGITATRGEVVAFLDDDAVAEPDWLERLIAPYADASVIGVGGAILPAWHEGRPSWFPEEFDWVVGCTYRGLPLERAPVRNLIGANMSFRRSAFAAAGGFAVEMGRTGSYPLGNDDTDFCLRVRRTLPGHALLYEPAARVLHTVPAARASWRYFRTRCFAEGLAKSDLTGVAGAADGLESERSYVARVLPRGVARGLVGAVSQRDLAGAARSLAIVAGLTVTTAGYAVGRRRALAPGVRRRTKLSPRRDDRGPGTAVG
jgi:GT2 family glycosyltransferase